MARTTRMAATGALFRALRGSMRPGEPSVRDRLRAVPRLVRATLSGAYTGTTRGRLAVLAAALFYVVSPVDLMPEMIVPLLGLADDAVVVAWLAGRLLGETETFLAWEREQVAGRPGRGPTGPRPGADVVRGHVIR